MDNQLALPPSCVFPTGRLTGQLVCSVSAMVGQIPTTPFWTAWVDLVLHQRSGSHPNLHQVDKWFMCHYAEFTEIAEQNQVYQLQSKTMELIIFNNRMRDSVKIQLQIQMILFGYVFHRNSQQHDGLVVTTAASGQFRFMLNTPVKDILKTFSSWLNNLPSSLDLGWGGEKFTNCIFW